MVIVGAGVAPATDFLKDTFQLEKDGSILVDNNLKVKQFDNIYAGGDIARYEYEFHDHEDTVRIEHWDVAQQHGRIAAKNMAGKKIDRVQVPFFWTSQQGKNFRYVGHAPDFDEVIHEGVTEGDDFAFVAYFVSECPKFFKSGQSGLTHARFWQRERRFSLSLP